MRTKHKQYTGIEKTLRGKTALVREGKKPGQVLAQFDDINLVYRNKALGFGWHAFAAEQFKQCEL